VLCGKRPKRDTPMDQFLHREELSDDERAILDLYLTGVAHALNGVNAVHAASDKEPIYLRPDDRAALEAAELKDIIDDFLKHRPDMKQVPLGLVAVTAVLYKFNP